MASGNTKPTFKPRQGYKAACEITPEDEAQIALLLRQGVKRAEISRRLRIAPFVINYVVAMAPLATDARPRKIDPEGFPRELREKLEMPIAELAIPPRLANTLERIGCLFVADLLGWRADELERVKGVGPVSMSRIFTALARLGLHRASSEPITTDIPTNQNSEAIR